MNDFDYDVLQKKRIANGARHIKRGSKSKKCTLPSDYLTKKQKRELNGTVDTYNLHAPMTWGEFKKMPLDLQQEYISYLRERFNLRQDSLALMFGVRPTSMCHFFSQHGLTWDCKVGRKRQTLEQAAEWKEFLDNTSVAEPVLREEEADESAPASNETHSSTALASAEVKSGSLTMTGNMADIASKLVTWLGVNRSYSVTIDFEVA